MQQAFVSAGWQATMNIYDSQREHFEKHLHLKVPIPFFPVTFRSPDKIAWHTKSGWIVADIVAAPCHYANHRTYAKLQSVLDTETH